MKSFNTKNSIIKFLTNYKQDYPLDRQLREYLKKYSSKQRNIIQEQVYGIYKNKYLLEHISPKPISALNLYNVYNSKNIQLQQRNLPLNIKYSINEDFLQYYTKTDPNIEDFLRISNERAPMYIRINPMKTNRKQLFQKLAQQNTNIQVGTQNIHSIKINKPIDLHNLDEFKQGHFIIQDENSQQCVDFIEIDQKMNILDFCAGAGGKSLGFSHKLNNTGQIFLHDIKSNKLQKAKKRFKLFNYNNINFVDDIQKLNHMKNKMDLVILDVPCSGTGTLRRNPDLKYKFDSNQVTYFTDLQKSIFKQAFEFVKSGGHIYYFTCSVIQDENENQIEFFQKNFLVNIVEQRNIQLKSGEGDAFYMAKIQKI